MMPDAVYLKNEFMPFFKYPVFIHLFYLHLLNTIMYGCILEPYISYQSAKIKIEN